MLSCVTDREIQRIDAVGPLEEPLAEVSRVSPSLVPREGWSPWNSICCDVVHVQAARELERRLMSLSFLSLHVGSIWLGAGSRSLSLSINTY